MRWWDGMWSNGAVWVARWGEVGVVRGAGVVWQAVERFVIIAIT